MNSPETETQTQTENESSNYSNVSALDILNMNNDEHTDNNESFEDNDNEYQSQSESESNDDDSDDYDEEYLADFDFSDDSSDDISSSSDDDEYELPNFIDTDLLESNPELKDRVNNYEKGVKKLVNRLKEKESSFQKIEPEFNTLKQWSDLLTNPATAKQALSHLVRETAKQHNFDVFDLYMDDDSDSPESEYDSNVDIDKIVESKLQQVIAPFQKELEELRAEKQKREYENNLSNYIEKVYKKTAKVIAENDNGWQITENQLKEAITQFPHLVKEPVKAVRMAFTDERIAHYQKATRSKDKAPNMISSKSSVGENFPTDSNKIKAMDILRMYSGK